MTATIGQSEFEIVKGVESDRSGSVNQVWYVRKADSGLLAPFMDVHATLFGRSAEVPDTPRTYLSFGGLWKIKQEEGHDRPTTLGEYDHAAKVAVGPGITVNISVNELLEPDAIAANALPVARLFFELNDLNRTALPSQ
jgi:hypothetical protein